MSWGYPMLHFLIGMSIIYFPQTQGKCSLKRQVEGCGTPQDGVQLECYGEHTRGPLKNWYCVLTSLNDSAENYTLVITQDPMPGCYNYNIAATKMPVKIKSTEVYPKKNMTAHLFDKSNCPKASFRGIPQDLVRCSPPTSVSFARLSGRLNVSLAWRGLDEKHFEMYTLRYKALDGASWTESQHTSKKACTVDNLDPSVPYVMQIRCSSTLRCPRCLWSPLYTLPPELNVQPVIDKVDIDARNGQRRILMRWKFASRAPVDGYRVNVGKASGEGPSDWINTTKPKLQLVLSYSAYRLNIAAFNNASISPAVSWAIPPHKHMVSDSRGGRLKVHFHSKKSLTLFWGDAEKIVCYSIELSSHGRKTQYVMFYEHNQNHTWEELSEPLEPYRMYDITLHTRTYRDTCNLKRVNNSESTYGSLQAYFSEGTPLSAPTNISSSNLTLSSMVITWQPVPVEDLRGHLLGYTLHYRDNGAPHASTERNVTVDPAVNAQELVDLKSDTMYAVQLSALTSAGAGVRSAPFYFETGSQGTNVQDSALQGALRNSLIACGVLMCVILFGSPLLKRAKGSFWPNVPDPGTSNAILTMDKSYELEPLRLTSLREDCDKCTLHLPSSEPPAAPYTALEGSGQSLGSPAGPAEPPWRDASTGTGGDTFSDDSRTATSGTENPAARDEPESAPVALHRGYTPMELFRQSVPLVDRAESHAVVHPETDTTGDRNGSDYVANSDL